MRSLGGSGYRDGVQHVGLVKAKCRSSAAKHHEFCGLIRLIRLYPYLYFFDTEVAFRGWFEFLEDAESKKRGTQKGGTKRSVPGASLTSDRVEVHWLERSG